jgi:hypothetical protein
MNEQQFPPLTLYIESKDYEVNDESWQEECRQLYQRLKRDLPDVTLEPVKQQPTGTGHKGILEVFHQLVMYGASMSSFANLWQLLKYWLERREKAEIMLRFPDGSVLKVRSLTQADAERKIREHLEAYPVQSGMPRADEKKIILPEG